MDDKAKVEKLMNLFPTRPCAKCETHSTLFSRSKSENRYKDGLSMCKDCGLSQKQKAMRRWKTVAIIFVTITKTTSEEDVNELANCSINDKPKPNSQLECHTIDIIEHATATSDIDPTPDSQDHDYLCRHIITQATSMERCWFQMKFIFRVINLLIEACQATLAQVNGHKLSYHVYSEVTVITSSVCFWISIFEFIVEFRVSGAGWKRRGCCYWIYYPGAQGQLFGNFSLYTGVVCSVIQFALNLYAVVVKKKVVQFEPLPLLFSIGQLIDWEALMVKCRLHNCALQCPQCVRLLREIEIEGVNGQV